VSFHNLQNDPVAWHILEERARVLASQKTLDSEELGEAYVIFRLGDNGYRIPTRFVREAQPLGRYSLLPSTPSFVVGLVNVYGRLLVALDLRPLLDIAPAPIQLGAYLLIVATSAMEVGIVADVIVGVQQGDSTLMPALSTTSGHRVVWAQGMDRDLNLQIDPELLFADLQLGINTAQQAMS
jgi:purine-binding chemotaxis protein CheW